MADTAACGRRALRLLTVLGLCLRGGSLATTTTTPRNLIHIIVDDLRTEIGAYTTSHEIHTPYIDELASRGVTFDRAYAQQALCNPSRASFMTGRRPDTTQVWNLLDNWRVKHQLWTSLPGMFLAGDMLSLGAGKTYHDTVEDGFINGLFEYDHARSWSPEALPYRNPCWTQGIDCAGCPDGGEGSAEAGIRAGGGAATAPAAGEAGGEAEAAQTREEDVGQEARRELSPARWHIGNVSKNWCVHSTGDLSDVLTTDHALSLLDTAVESGKAFYLAVGYHKPHLPWIAKQEYFDLYDLDSIALARVKTLPASIPEIAFNDCDSPSPWDPITDDQARLARRAYYAATSGMDAEVGRILRALDAYGPSLVESTAILLHGDHGWQLGERAGWRKNANWENAVRVPFILAVPWLNGTANTRSDELAELVDVMPTLAELAGVEVPTTKLGDRLAPPEGTSLVPALVAAAARGAATEERESARTPGKAGKVKSAAFSQYPRKPRDETEAWAHNSIDHDDPSLFTFMGYSIRVDDWRLTDWYRWDGESLRANFSAIFATELYDWRDANVSDVDYDSFENENVADNPDYAEVRTFLSPCLPSSICCDPHAHILPSPLHPFPFLSVLSFHLACPACGCRSSRSFGKFSGASSTGAEKFSSHYFSHSRRHDVRHVG